MVFVDGAALVVDTGVPVGAGVINGAVVETLDQGSGRAVGRSSRQPQNFPGVSQVVLGAGVIEFVVLESHTVVPSLHPQNLPGVKQDVVEGIEVD